jgi:hypothetical protein
MDEREKHARLVEVMMDQTPWRDYLWARSALAAAGAAIRRGRHLTEAEKLENLAKAMEEPIGNDTEEDRAEGQRAAAKLREWAKAAGE